MPKHYKISGLLLFFLVLICFPLAKSQDNSSLLAQNFHQWGAVTLFNGLPSDTVRAIAQTPDGVLWFGTDNGLARFDGRRVQTITLEITEAKRILALKVAPGGTLWVGTQNGAFRYREGKFQKIDDTQNYAVTAFLFGENIFLATENGAILRLRENAENIFTIEKIPDQPILGGDNQFLRITSLARIGRQSHGGDLQPPASVFRQRFSGG
jgi:hypothetical protein